MSQETLGAAAGLSFQQVHKYESGCPGVPASCLFEFAKALDVPPSFFFQGPRLTAKDLMCSTTAAATIPVMALEKSFAVGSYWPHAA